MPERRKSPRNRSFKGGRIVTNHRQSVISCTVRNLSAHGANLQVDNPLGIPAFFDLIVDGRTRSCDVIWKAANRLGVTFSDAAPVQLGPGNRSDVRDPLPERSASSLEAALDQVRVGIVLLDAQLRALFINRAFRTMWRLPDAKADSRPAFVTLMYHGRDTRAYDVPDENLNAYVEARVAHVREGVPTPIDLRLRGGEIIRFQSARLPYGGRLLSYTDVTDIVRRADELEQLRAALDNVEQGVILLDRELNAQFLNTAVRRMWGISEDLAARKPPFADLVAHTRTTNALGMDEDLINIFLNQRLARVRRGDSRPMDMHRDDGRVIRAHCSALPSGGRMLTYTDVTDLVRRADDAAKAIAIPRPADADDRTH